MPGRLTPLVTNEIYHVYNRGVNRQPTFLSKKEYKRAKETIFFYRSAKIPMSFSKFLVSDNDKQKDILEFLKSADKLVEILCYCLMPNHFHILLRQLKDNGISKYLSNVQNSYTRYSNKRHERDGSLFLDQFKAVRKIKRTS